MTNEVLTPVQGRPAPARDDNAAEFRRAAIGYDYVHAIPGRLRLRASATRRNLANAEAVKTVIEGLTGVNSVAVNELTGSITVLYDNSKLNSASLLDALRNHPGLQPVSKDCRPVSTAAARLARAVLMAVLEQAVVALL